MRAIYLPLLLLCHFAIGQNSFLRLSGDGNLKRYSNTLQIAADGGYVQAGTQEADPEWTVYIEKYDVQGNSLWKSFFCPSGLGGDCEIYSGLQTADGGYLFTGLSDSGTASNYDIFLIKTDAEGALIWTKSYAIPGKQWGYKVLESNFDQQIYIAGWSDESGNADFILLKTDPDGNLLTTRTIVSAAREYCVDAVEVTGIGIIMVGYRYNLNNYLKMRMLHYDGTIVWEQEDPTGQSGEITAVTMLSPVSFAVVGYRFPQSYLRVYNTGGFLLWQSYLSIFDSILWLTGVDATSDEEIWVTGIKGTSNNYDVFIAKYNNVGNELLRSTYDLGGQEYPEAIRSCPDGGAAITGLSSNYAFLLKLFEDGALPAPEIAQPTTDIRILPNPSRGTFQVQLPAPGAYNFQLFDVQGKMIYAAAVDSRHIVEQQLPPGMYFGTWVRADGVAFSAKIFVE